MTSSFDGPNMLAFYAQRIQQPIGTFYVGAIPACRLMELAAADVRRLTHRDVEEYSGIQRVLSPRRVREIQDYIGTVDASFPNCIILNLPEVHLSTIEDIISPDIVRLTVEENEGTFQIIDGQHRLAGFESKNCGDFDLIVAVFVELALEDQAYLFSNINLTQTKVNRSLVYDLFDVAETRSPQKSAHVVTRMLNSNEDSPFYRRIKILGTTPKIGGDVLYRPILAQGTIIMRMISYISDNPQQDRDDIKRGRTLRVEGDEVERGLIFRKFFIEEKEWAIYKIMVNYFNAVRRAFTKEWESMDNPLSKTIGYGALMGILRPIYQVAYAERDSSEEFFFGIFRGAYDRYVAEGPELRFENFPASGAGENQLRSKLEEWCGLGKG